MAAASSAESGSSGSHSSSSWDGAKIGLKKELVLGPIGANSLNFDYATGTKIAAGCNDGAVKIWDWENGHPIVTAYPGRFSGVCDTKFIPVADSGTMKIVTSNKNGLVILTEFDQTGVQVGFRRPLVVHEKACSMLAVHPDTPQVILSCGIDSVVYSLDTRKRDAEKILSVFDYDRKIQLCSIDSNPVQSNEFIVSGNDQYVRAYDVRMLSTSTVTTTTDGLEPAAGSSSSPQGPSTNSVSPPLKRFCASHLDHPTMRNADVTRSLYSYDGKEILGTYGDEESKIYLFDATNSSGKTGKHLKVYKGHRNHVMVWLGALSFYGDKSQYVVSGSDCGRIFVWNKETTATVNSFQAQDFVVGLTSHPRVQVLASMGMDDGKVKIWTPPAHIDASEA